MKSRALTLACAALLIGTPTAMALADDSEIFRRQTSSPPGATEIPEPEGEHAFIKLMNFRVPAQLANGTLTTIDYVNIDGDTINEDVDTAKPLINAYVYGPVITFDDFSQSGFPGHGRRDAFAAVSLDDGATWKRTNLSRSADKSSFTVSTPIPDPGLPGFDLDGPSVALAKWDDDGKLEVKGSTETDSKENVLIRNGVTGDEIYTVNSDKDGEFEAEKKVSEAPCYVQAGVDGIFGPLAAVENAPEDCTGTADISPEDGELGYITDYPGDVTNIFHAVAGNKVLVAWQSKFCSAGFPGYTGGASGDAESLAGYLGIVRTADLYLEDLFGVAGSQLSVDYREQEEFSGEYAGVGEVPYNCLWSARGVLRENPEAVGTTEVVWFQAERLTSGRRDVNRIETACVAGGGCAITWQEDPKGLRPGEGEGAGTGWAGATTNSQTDIWYSFIEWEDFDIVYDGTAGIPLEDNILDTGRPKPYVPMAVPMRLSNNARCTNQGDGFNFDYCDDAIAGAYGIKNQCIDTVDIPAGPNQELRPTCVVDANGDGVAGPGDMVNIANTAASRPRLNLQPRDVNGDTVADDAWVLVIYEEDKGLGRYGFLNDEAWDGNVDNTGTACPDPRLDPDDNCEREIGKNQLYISFALGGPNTYAGVISAYDFDLVDNLVAQQNQYNAPEVNWFTGTFYPPMDTADMWDFGDYNYLIFNTEIARRASLMSQSLAKATTFATSGLMAMPLFKEGIINQGGPADIMARRIVLPEGFPGEATANPYAFENLACEWYDGEGNAVDGTVLFTDGLNPYYPKGLCTAPAINLSARTPYTCEASGISDGTCPAAADLTCTDDAEFGQLCLSTVDPEDNQLLDKLVTWYECPGSSGNTVGGTGAAMPACYTQPESTLLMANVDDRSWYTPMDISKAHRGFLDGDFVFLLYAWSPNWKLNAVGRDRYELYTRRSFNGGISWTTTPGSFLASDGNTYNGDGTTTCETWRDGADSTTDSHVCTAYGAGDAEQSRNVTQHKSMRVTTLDPRYSPTIASMPTEGDLEWVLFEPLGTTDVRRPDRNFVVFETGDNTTVAEGEAEPLNLDYGRAVMFGDHFQVWAEEDDIDVCYPNDPKGDDTVGWAAGTGFCNEFDTMEGFPLSLSEEASITSSAAGDFLYGSWGQFNVEENPETGELEFVDGDVMFRRIWFLDGYISLDNAWTLPGDAQ